MERRNLIKMDNEMKRVVGEGITEKVEMYREDIEALVKYLPWLESKNKKDLSSSYTPREGGEHSLRVPVYDSTLLGFIKAAQKTKFIDRNYVYVYHRKRMNTVEDELKMIKGTQMMEIENLGAVLSKYVIQGMSKSVMWNEGVSNGVFYAIVSKMKELLEFWSRQAR